MNERKSERGSQSTINPIFEEKIGWFWWRYRPAERERVKLIDEINEWKLMELIWVNLMESINERGNSIWWNQIDGAATKATQPSINTTKQRHLLFVDDWLVCCLAGPYFHSINQLNLLPFPFQKNSWLIPFQSLHKLGYFNSTW